MTPAVTPELVAALKRLRLGRIAETLPDRLVLAGKQDMAFDDLLLLIITDEINRRDARPTSKTLNEAVRPHHAARTGSSGAGTAPPSLRHEREGDAVELGVLHCCIVETALLEEGLIGQVRRSH